MTSRRQSRELAFRAVYQADVTGETPKHCLEEILEETPSSDEIRAFAATLVAELEQHRENVDAIVSRTAHNWPLRRMAATDRSVLRLAVVELLHHAETPTRVALEIRASAPFVGTPTRRDRWRRTSGIHKVRNRHALAAVRELWTTRDHIARRRDIAPGRILPDSAIIDAAIADPTTVDELTALPMFGGSNQRRTAQVWLDALTRARDDEGPPEIPSRERPAARLAVGRANRRRPRAWRPPAPRWAKLSAAWSVPDREPGVPRPGPPAVLGLADRGGATLRRPRRRRRYLRDGGARDWQRERWWLLALAVRGDARAPRDRRRRDG